MPAGQVAQHKEDDGHGYDAEEGQEEDTDDEGEDGSSDAEASDDEEQDGEQQSRAPVDETDEPPEVGVEEGSTESDRSDDSSADDDEEEEPTLKYARLGGETTDILSKDTASALAVSSKFIVRSPGARALKRASS